MNLIVMKSTYFQLFVITWKNCNPIIAFGFSTFHFHKALMDKNFSLIHFFHWNTYIHRYLPMVSSLYTPVHEAFEAPINQCIGIYAARQSC